MNKQGFLVTCIKNKEQSSQKEVMDQIYSSNYNPHLVKESDNFKKELEVALSNLKKKKFELISLRNTQCIYLIQTMEDVLKIHKNFNINLKYTFKIIPLQKLIFINNFSPLNLSFIFDDLIFKLNLEKEKTYKINYEHRNTAKEKKEEIFNYLAKNIKLKVNLKEPDYIFNVQIVKNYLGCSVLKN
ncbi:hypothetical protein TUBRATIS_005940 [Tubulinosema ratisbonensis]|uniref:THUMP domain-containing protein n=1 Tax=Tubulinosema ratisbonensis TaxID=291195 RepID=A0A437APH2_9MICR|nr:hypothetical protein TUBRATIS_005940 [Tubulinosema ratisbonensis]